MLLYDKAYELANEIRSSEEYKQYKEIKGKVYVNEMLKQKIKNFDRVRYEMQVLALQGEKQDEAKMLELENQYKELLEDEDAKKYFEAELRFNVILADVNKIIGEVVKEVLN